MLWANVLTGGLIFRAGLPSNHALERRLNFPTKSHDGGFVCAVGFHGKRKDRSCVHTNPRHELLP